MDAYQKGSSVLKNSLVAFSGPVREPKTPILWCLDLIFEAFWSCFGLPAGPTSTFSTGWEVFDTGQTACSYQEHGIGR
jgi:hypothetical protein